MDTDVQRGRWLLLMVIAVTLLGDAMVVSLKVAAVGVEHSGASVIRWTISAGLCIAIWHGAEWARWLMITLLSVAILYAASFMVFESFHPLMLAILAQFGIALVPLAFSSSITNFMEFQSMLREPSLEQSPGSTFM